VLALALATLPLVSPLDQAGDKFLLSAHMLQHVLIGDAAPALALVVLRGPLLFFVLPAPILRVLGHRRRLRGTLAFLLRPPVSLALWALVIGAWHVPAAYTGFSPLSDLVAWSPCSRLPSRSAASC